MFTANPEDYGARQDHPTPLDRIGSVRTHYPATHNAMACEQEAWTERADGLRVEIPDCVREVVEEVARTRRCKM